MDNLQNEIWKDIPNYEGLYRISNYGRIFMINRNRLKAFGDNMRGYYHVSLTKNGVQKIYKVHRLVATLFVENPNNKPQVNHKDGVKTNNFFENLEWVTLQENIDHFVKSGKPKKYKSLLENSLRRKADFDSGLTNKELAEKWGISQKTVVGYLSYHNWSRGGKCRRPSVLRLNEKNQEILNLKVRNQTLESQLSTANQEIRGLREALETIKTYSAGPAITIGDLNEKDDFADGHVYGYNSAIEQITEEVIDKVLSHPTPGDEEKEILKEALRLATTSDYFCPDTEDEEFICGVRNPTTEACNECIFNYYITLAHSKLEAEVKG